MAQQSPRISEAEWFVMQVLWGRSPLTAAEVAHEPADDTEWSPRTVKTLLARLVKKGALVYEEEGRRYLYSPCVTRTACLDAERRSLADRAFDGATSPLLIHFVKSSRLSRSEIEELQRILEEKRPSK